MILELKQEVLRQSRSMVVVERVVDNEVVIVDVDGVVLAGVESEIRLCLLLFCKCELAVAESILLNAKARRTKLKLCFYTVTMKLR